MDTCPICFEDLDGKVKASPNTCDHVFCLPCIEKWAKLGSFCPVDRKRFRKIVNLDSENFIQVKPSKRKKRKTVYDFSAKCEVCLKSSNANVLLLCDCCDLGYHLFCLNPPLKTVPAGLWFCPTCVSVESRLKKNKGITKELEADLGNGTLQLEKGKESGIKNIDTQDKKQNSEELINKEKNVNKFIDTRTLNNEQCCSVAEACSKVASEFEGLNVEKNCSQGIVTYSLKDTNQRECETENSFKCMKNANGRFEKEYIKCSPARSEIRENSELLYSDDLCLNKTQKDDSLLDDCLAHSVLYGDMKIGISEEKMIESLLDKSCTNIKCVHSSTCCKSLHGVRFRKKIPEISPPSHPHSSKIISNENIFQPSTSSFHNCSKDWMQGNAGHEDASNMNVSSPCSSISAESNKGSFKHFISDVSIENCLEELSNEIYKIKTVKGHQKEREIQFSVFERKEGTDASQKKYSELSSKACISFSSNLNVEHCVYCRDMILAASQNSCKICKLYTKNSIRKKTNTTSTKSSHMSKKFEFPCVASVSNKFLNFQYQGNTMEKRMSASERRQYSLLRELQKIHKAQEKLIDTQK